jgi:hypothetical protein
MTATMLELADELRTLATQSLARIPAWVLDDWDESTVHRDGKGRFAEHPGVDAPDLGIGTPGGETSGSASPKTGQAALDSAPVRLTRPPGGHGGDYTGADITGPPGRGSAQALAEMEGVEHETTNSYLRNVGKPPPPSSYTPTPEDEQRQKDHAAKVEARIAEVDKSMSVSPLADPVVVYRGVKDGSVMFGDTWYGKYADPADSFDKQDQMWELWQAGERPDLTGVTWEEKAYSHTTVNSERLSGYAQKLPEQEPVAMTIVVPAGTGAVQMSEIDHEAELMLERGLKYRVVADHGIDGGGVRRLDVEVIPHG